MCTFMLDSYNLMRDTLEDNVVWEVSYKQKTENPAKAEMLSKPKKK